MSDPRRLFDDAPDPATAELMRSLLASGRDVEPPPAARDAVWTSIQAAILVPPPGGGLGGGDGGAGAASSASGAPGAASGTAGAASAGGGAGSVAASAAGSTAAVAGKGLFLTAKIGLATLVAGGVVAVAVVATRPAEVSMTTSTSPSDAADGTTAEPPPASMFLAPPRAAATALPEATAIDLDRASPPVPSAEARPPSTDPHGAATETPDDRALMLKSEAEGVQRARNQLSQGNAQGALATLGELDRAVPRGVLGQERALYTVLALSASGQHERASRQADAFLRAYPNSPHAERVRGLTQR